MFVFVYLVIQWYQDGFLWALHVNYFYHYWKNVMLWCAQHGINVFEEVCYLFMLVLVYFKEEMLINQHEFLNTVPDFAKEIIFHF